MKKKVSVVKEVFKSLFKTLAILLTIVVFSALSFYVINPRFSAGVCKELGWKKAEISCYELLYARNKDTSDLYNLIVKLGNVEDYQKQNDYIEKLQNVETYAAFCDTMDSSVLSGYTAGEIEAKNLSLLYGTNEYLTSTKVVNLLKLQKYEDAYNALISTKSTDKTYELVLYNYVENLYANTAISDEIKNNYFAKIVTDFTEYLQNKLFLLPGQVDSTMQIIKAYAKLKIEYTEYIIALQTKPDAIASTYVNWQEAQNAYNNLIG